MEAHFYTDRGMTLQAAKDHLLIEVESWYGGAVLDVFDSAATGVNRRYYCAEADQLRMINGRVSNTAVTLMCGVVPATSDTDPAYTWLLHSATEAGKVHTDYVQFSKGAAEQYALYKQQIAAATQLSELDALFAGLWG